MPDYADSAVIVGENLLPTETAETPEAVLRKGTFLNRALLAAGLAARFRE